MDPKSPHPPVLSPSSSTLFSEVELTKPIKIKLKTSSSESSTPAWKDYSRELEAEASRNGNQSPPSSNLGSPVVKQLDPRDRLTFGKIPMDETPDLVSCPKCERPIIRHAIKMHLEGCKGKETSKKLNGTSNGSDKEKVNGNGKEAPNGEIKVLPPKSKKRKHDEAADSTGEITPPKKKSSKKDKEKDDADTPTKKEKEKEKEKKKKLKQTVAKPKLPVDPEKQCAVYDPEKGTLCARSLTCKSHSMSAKRAVKGRSQPYDVLLSQWQRKNQVKTATMQKTAVQQEQEDVDSEEEVRMVMQGVFKRYARPMEQRCLVGVKRKVRGMRLYEGFRSTLLAAVQNVAGTGMGRGRRQSQAAEAG